MLAIMFLSLQSAASPAAVPEKKEREILMPERELAEFDLAKIPEDKSCSSRRGDEIVVCASRDLEPGRLNEIQGPVFAEDDGRAEFALGDGMKAAVETEQVDLGGGIISNRVMARFKIKF